MTTSLAHHLNFDLLITYTTPTCLTLVHMLTTSTTHGQTTLTIVVSTIFGLTHLIFNFFFPINLMTAILQHSAITLFLYLSGLSLMHIASLHIIILALATESSITKLCQLTNGLNSQIFYLTILAYT